MSATIPKEERSPAGTEAAARLVLESVFGFSSFRPGQEEVVESVLAGRDTLAVMPTSGGKSLCYQVPALLGGGLTLVVSPLVSLMADQEISLKRRYEERGLGAENAPVAALHSGLSAARERRVVAGVASGFVKILLVAPERLRSLAFVLSLRRASSGRGVGLFVVDEAHCVSEWGHSFRPEYLHAKTVVEDLRRSERRQTGRASLPVLALTATADPRVRGDVVRLLGMRNPQVVMTGFDRPNLDYAVEKVDDGEDRAPRVLDAIRRSGTPAIVYAHSRRECDALAASLDGATGGPGGRSLRTEAYHAGMGSEARARVQGRFMGDETDVVVATIAFGMGVDKPDVRNVVHASLPASIPAYVQEAGRAGRDGRPASCTVIYSAEEASRRKRLAAKDPTTAADAYAFFEALKSAAEGTAGGRRAYLSHAELFRLGGLGKEQAGDVLRALEATGTVERRYDLWETVAVEGFTEASPKDKEAGEAKGPVACVRQALRRIARARGRGNALVVGMEELARKARVSRAVTEGAVLRLAAEGELRVRGTGSRADVVLKAEELTPKDLEALGERFSEAALKEVHHLEDVENYTSLSSCRRQRLLSYFGDETAVAVAPCDGCDVCRTRPGGRSGARKGAPEGSLLARLWKGIFP